MDKSSVLEVLYGKMNGWAKQTAINKQARWRNDLAMHFRAGI